MEEKKLNEPSPLAALVRTKAYLLDHGWRQHAYGRRGGPACLAGALNHVGGVRTRVDVALRRANSIITIIAWNDDKDRTEKQVLAAIDKAIDLVAKERWR